MEKNVKAAQKSVFKSSWVTRDERWVAAFVESRIQFERSCNIHEGAVPGVDCCCSWEHIAADRHVVTIDEGSSRETKGVQMVLGKPVDYAG